MLIIFDLDDTLIDTSGCITPVKLEHALKRMIAEGLAIDNHAQALKQLLFLDSGAESARNALSEFLEIMEGEEKFYLIGETEIYGAPPPDIAIFPLEQAVEILAELKEHHHLALVSVGNAAHQFLKMKKAGIDSTIFSKIVISEDRDKKPHYQAIVKELGYDPQETIVCGDRIAIDLAPAKELGCKTVHMRWGRGLNTPASVKGDVDFSITELKQIKEILTQL